MRHPRKLNKASGTCEQPHREPYESTVLITFPFVSSSILRGAQQLYGHDSDFQAISLYVRHNRARQGSLKTGDRAVDVDLLDRAGERVTLLNCHRARPLLVIAGSYT